MQAKLLRFLPAMALASADPRPSLEERYGTHQGYVDAVEVCSE